LTSPRLAEAEQRARILQAAERVFVRDGYGEATIEAVAHACGMAKKTLYKHYADKAALFAGMIADPPTPPAEGTGSAGPPESLEAEFRALLSAISAFVLSPRQLSLTQLVIGEARKHPELAERFHTTYVENTIASLTQSFLRRSAPLAPPGVDLSRLVDLVIGATLGPLPMRALMLNLDPETLREELRERMESTLAVLRAAMR
jgi:AcrR family transcriptional regulator